MFLDNGRDLRRNPVVGLRLVHQDGSIGFDHRIQDAKVLSGDDLGVVITDDFILVPNPRSVDPDRDYVIKFKAQRVD